MLMPMCDLCNARADNGTTLSFRSGKDVHVCEACLSQRPVADAVKAHADQLRATAGVTTAPPLL
jgi:hypothetical protein